MDPQDGTILVPAVRGGELPGLRTRTSSRTSSRTSEDEDGLDGDEDVRGRQGSDIT